MSAPKKEPVVLTDEEKKEFERLLNENDGHVQRVLMRYLARLMLPPDVRDDLYSEIMQRAIRSFRSWKREGLFLSWIMTIADRTIAGWKHKKSRDADRFTLLAEQRMSSPSSILDMECPEEELLQEEKRIIARRIRETIPAELEKYYAFYESGMTHKEIADRLQVTESTARRRVLAALDYLQSRGKEYEGVIPLLAGVEEHYLALYRQVCERVLGTGVETGVATTSATGASAAFSTATGAAVRSTVYGILISFAMPALCIFSSLIGGQFFGTMLVRNLRSLQLRRWLTRRLFLGYALLAAMPLYFYFIEFHLRHTIDHGVSYLAFFITAAIFFCRTRRSYHRYTVEGIPVEPPLNYRCLRFLIYGGLALLTVLYGLLAESWYREVVLPALEHHRMYVAEELKNRVIQSSILFGGLLTVFHLSSSFLFHYFLRISRDDSSLDHVSFPVGIRFLDRLFAKNEDRFYQTSFILLVVVGFIFGWGWNINHLVSTKIRLMAPILEMAAICLWWAYVLKQHPDDSKKRFSLATNALIIEVVVMFVLRMLIYQ